jgi:hypothetical protein
LKAWLLCWYYLSDLDKLPLIGTYYDFYGDLNYLILAVNAEIDRTAKSFTYLTSNNRNLGRKSITVGSFFPYPRLGGKLDQLQP